VTQVQKNSSHEATPSHREGPSWGLMLVLIVVAMLVATGIAWMFIHPFFMRH
jgi:flagellar basal body-associated protein FliL